TFRDRLGWSSRWNESVDRVEDRLTTESKISAESFVRSPHGPHVDKVATKRLQQRVIQRASIEFAQLDQTREIAQRARRSRDRNTVDHEEIPLTQVPAFVCDDAGILR